jgi:hypothetical protein
VLPIEEKSAIVVPVGYFVITNTMEIIAGSGAAISKFNPKGKAGGTTGSSHPQIENL